ncbi:Eco57I restriction-modification methylase domain-containing protein [Actinomadura luteofluorescens]|uniref:Eco57I restriction-modification methylase domain-containing protein n=1 Tax=Actinomadura luteofluorescens TaxID=46163 RepID=UPI003D9297FB
MSDPFLEIYEAVPAWEEQFASETADLIAGGAPLLWQDIPNAKGDNPTRAHVASAVASALGMLRSWRLGGVDFAGRHWCQLPHVGCTDWDEAREAPSGFDAGLGVGSVYTPRWLADKVAEQALEPLVYLPGPRETGDRDAWRLRPSDEILALRVIDIAAGAGAMLVAACRYLAERVADAWEQERGERPVGTEWEAARLVAADCLYGVDVNPLALELAKVAIHLISHLHVREPAAMHDHFQATDALLGREFPQMFPDVFQDRGGFDAVIGNPPWLGGMKITGEFGTAYRDRLVKEIAYGKRGSADLSAYFVLRGWGLLNARGQLAMICTNTIAQGATHRVGLAQIVDDGDGTIMWAIKSRPWPVASVAAHYAAFSISKAPVAADAPRFLDLGEAAA